MSKSALTNLQNSCSVFVRHGCLIWVLCKMANWLLSFCMANINHNKWPFFFFLERHIISINCYRQEKNSRECIFSSGIIVEYSLQFSEDFLSFICPAEEDLLTCCIKYPWRFKPSKKTPLGAVLEEEEFSSWNKPYTSRLMHM